MLTDTWIAKLFFTVPQKTSLYHLKKMNSFLNSVIANFANFEHLKNVYIVIPYFQNMGDRIIK